MKKFKGTYLIQNPPPPDPEPVQGCTNPLANNYDENAVIDDGSCTFDAVSISAIISDALPSHAAIVKQAFDDNYEPDNAVVYNQRDEDLFEFGEAIGVKAIIKSYTGMFSHIPLATEYYPNVPFFMPLGSNESIELPNPSTMSVIVACGATNDENGVNETGYGMGLEFFDLELYNVPSDESSFSTPIIAAKFLTIMDARECGFWEARQAARATAIRTITSHPNGEIWNKFNGFGVIDVDAAIAYDETIIADPFVNNGNVYYPYIPS